MSDHFHNLSRRLYDVMERVGASEDMRSLHQSSAINREITYTAVNHLTHKPGQQFIFGSFSEGTTTPGLPSDMDILVLLFNDDCTMVENIRDAAGYHESYLMVRDNDTKPGYVKLQEVHNGLPETVKTMDMNISVDSDCDGRICLKHISACGENEFVSERNGPADTVLSSTSISMDIVTAFRCATVPDCASEWTSRHRPYNWPSVQMIDEMKSSGCFVVGVGHPGSDEKDIEWRLSFSLQERQLMFSLNPVQHKCYILLKMIKHDLIESKLEKSISSYHCKTCLFHVIENNPPNIWTPENLFSCVCLCLNKLRDYVMSGNCPNYFIKKENMFDRDVHERVKPRLTEILTQLISKGHRLLFNIKCDQIGDIMKGHEDFGRISMSVSNRRRILKHSKLTLSSHIQATTNRLLIDKDLISICCWLSTSIREITSCVHISDYDEHQQREEIDPIISFLHSRLAQQLVSLACSDGFLGNPLMDYVLYATNDHFRKSSSSDVTSTRLVYASVLYKFGQYDICVDLLDQINMDLQPDIETVCFCSEGKCNESVENIPDENVPSSVSSTASCVMFLPSDITIAPPPLQYEMYRSVDTPPGSRDEKKDYWYDCAVVDAKVYTHCLKYLAYSEMNKLENKQLAISNMRRMLEKERNLGHRETGYNLLGWIYIQENCITEGVHCFIESWRIKPHHNAAKWQLGCAVYTQISHITTPLNNSCGVQ